MPRSHWPRAQFPKSHDEEGNAGFPVAVYKCHDYIFDIGTKQADDMPDGSKQFLNAPDDPHRNPLQKTQKIISDFGGFTELQIIQIRHECDLHA